MDMGADQNIYEIPDLESSNCDQNIEELMSENHMFEQHIISLEGDIEKLTKFILEMKNVQKNLSANISSLYRTAKAEIERKDRMIAELRQQLDNLVFKRTTSNKPKLDDRKGYSQGSDNNSQRKDNYKDRDKTNACMIADLRHQSDNLDFNRTDIEPTTKNCNLTGNTKPELDDSKGYNRRSGNNSQRKDNYEHRHRSNGRYSYGIKTTRTGNGRPYEERESRISRELDKKRARESHEEYEEKLKLSSVNIAEEKR